MYRYGRDSHLQSSYKLYRSKKKDSFINWKNMNILELSDSIRDNVSSEVIKLKSIWIFPRIAVILIWENDSARIYARIKKRVGEQLGIQVDIDVFSPNTNQRILEEYITKKSSDKTVHGILLESPFPDWLDFDSAVDAIHPHKDIDGLHILNQWKLLRWDLCSWLIPATPLACIAIIQNQVSTLVGKNIVVVWRWRTVWIPLANLLISNQSTVTVANSRTINLPELCKNADIVITATWKHGVIGPDMVHQNSIIIDAWISTNRSWWIVGDVDYTNVVHVAKFVTPVPWWVGLITTWIIFQNLIRAIGLQKWW